MQEFTTLVGKRMKVGSAPPKADMAWRTASPTIHDIIRGARTVSLWNIVGIAGVHALMAVSDTHARSLARFAVPLMPIMARRDFAGRRCGGVRAA